MPAQPLINGPARVCKSTTRQFSIPSGSPVLWKVESGPATIATNQTTLLNPNIDFGATSGIVGLSVTVGSTCQTKGYFYVTVEDGVGTIAGLTNYFSCYTTTYTTPAPATWSVTNGTLVDPQGFTTMRIRWAGAVASGTVSAAYLSPAGCPKTKSLTVTLTPSISTITATDGLPTNEWCFKALRTFQTESGWSNYVWTINTSPITTVAKTETDPYRNQFTLPTASIVNLSDVVISVIGSSTGCTSATTQISMKIIPATINFRGSPSDIPTVCYNGSQNIGAYSTDAGHNNYSWSVSSVANIGSGAATTPNSQTTNMDYLSAGSANGGLIPVTVTYTHGSLGCINTNRPRSGVSMLKPTISGIVYPNVGGRLFYSISDATGYEYSWAITAPSSGAPFGIFVDPLGTPITPVTETHIQWNRNNEPDPIPTLSVSYWRYLPQVNGTRFSFCTASKPIDIKAFQGSPNRQASDISTSLAEEIERSAFRAYPSPADDALFLRNVPLGAIIKMISMNGAESISTIQDLEGLKKRIETSALPSGVYVLRTFDLDNNPVSMRVIISH